MKNKKCYPINMLGDSALTFWQTKNCCMVLLNALGRVSKFVLRCKNLYRIGPWPFCCPFKLGMTFLFCRQDKFFPGLKYVKLVPGDWVVPECLDLEALQVLTVTFDWRQALLQYMQIYWKWETAIQNYPISNQWSSKETIGTNFPKISKS